MSEVILIRPGATDFDEQNRIQGALDLPLSDRGLAQVDAIVEQLREVPLEVIYTAASEPARSTAAAIGRRLDVPVKEADGLRSLNQGLWQGLQVDEIRRKYPKICKQWRESPESICPPQGETVAGALERTGKALRKLLKRKAPFAIVASEPLATLIRCMIVGHKPEVPGPICGGGQDQLVEVVQTNGTATNGTATNGTATNGTAANGTPTNGTPTNGTASNGTPQPAVENSVGENPSNVGQASGCPSRGEGERLPANGQAGSPPYVVTTGGDRTP